MVETIGHHCWVNIYKEFGIFHLQNSDIQLNSHPTYPWNHWSYKHVALSDSDWVRNIVNISLKMIPLKLSFYLNAQWLSICSFTITFDGIRSASSDNVNLLDRISLDPIGCWNCTKVDLTPCHPSLYNHSFWWYSSLYNVKPKHWNSLNS